MATQMGTPGPGSWHVEKPEDYRGSGGAVWERWRWGEPANRLKRSESQSCGERLQETAGGVSTEPTVLNPVPSAPGSESSSIFFGLESIMQRKIAGAQNWVRSGLGDPQLLRFPSDLGGQLEVSSSENEGEFGSFLWRHDLGRPVTGQGWWLRKSQTQRSPHLCHPCSSLQWVASSQGPRFVPTGIRSRHHPWQNAHHLLPSSWGCRQGLQGSEKKLTVEGRL